MHHSVKTVLGLMFTLLFITAPAMLFAEGERSIQVGLAGGVLSHRNIENLNDRLEAQGYPAFETTYGTMGGLLRLRLDRLMVGIEGHAFRSEPETSGVYELTLSGGYAMIEAGYDLFRSGGFRIFPLIGIGGGGTRLHIINTQDVAFDAMLASPGRESSVAYGGLMVNASLAIEYYARITEKSGLVVGFQAGYNQTIYSDGRWRFEGERRNAVEATGGPDVDLNGAALNLNIGWLFEL
jgi:opacity protein-like surface antigen